MIHALKRLLAAFVPARYQWARRMAGGHWELVDFDRLYTQFSGRMWMRFDHCSTHDLGFRSNALIKCEDWGPPAQDGSGGHQHVYREAQDPFEQDHRDHTVR